MLFFKLFVSFLIGASIIDGLYAILLIYNRSFNGKDETYSKSIKKYARETIVLLSVALIILAVILGVILSSL